MIPACPGCGENERLRGSQTDRGIVIRCESCGSEWLRDPDVCPNCGRRSLADVREPLFQKARGTQQSIVGYRIETECWACGYRSAER